MKTTFMKRLLALVCMICLCLGLMACGSNQGGTENPSETEKDSQNTETQVDTDATEEGSEETTEFEENTEDTTVEETEETTEEGSEEETESETTVDTNNSENNNSESNDTESSNTGSNTGSNNGASTETETETEIEDETLGAGSEADPYYEIPVVDGDTMTLTTVSIPAGKSVFYQVYRIAGMILTINDANAYVVCDGTKYEATGGKVSFQVPGNMASDAIGLEIGNKGGAAVTYTITFTNPTGSYMNPTGLSAAGTTISLHVNAGEEMGHYYKYVAEKTGVLTMYIKELSSKTRNAKAYISATNNNTYANRTTDSDGVEDGNFVKIKMEVTAGDEIMIQVGASPTSTWKYPEEDIVWIIEFQ